MTYWLGRTSTQLEATGVNLTGEWNRGQNWTIGITALVKACQTSWLHHLESQWFQNSKIGDSYTLKQKIDSGNTLHVVPQKQIQISCWTIIARKELESFLTNYSPCIHINTSNGHTIKIILLGIIPKEPKKITTIYL